MQRLYRLDVGGALDGAGAEGTGRVGYDHVGDRKGELPGVQGWPPAPLLPVYYPVVARFRVCGSCALWGGRRTGEVGRDRHHRRYDDERAEDEEETELGAGALLVSAKGLLGGDALGLNEFA